MQTVHYEAACLLPHDRRQAWGTMRAATPLGLWRKLGADVSLTRCYEVRDGKRKRIDLEKAVRA